MNLTRVGKRGRMRGDCGSGKSIASEEPSSQKHADKFSRNV